MRELIRCCLALLRRYLVLLESVVQWCAVSLWPQQRPVPATAGGVSRTSAAPTHDGTYTTSADDSTHTLPTWMAMADHRDAEATPGQGADFVGRTYDWMPGAVSSHTLPAQAVPTVKYEAPAAQRSTLVAEHTLPVGVEPGDLPLAYDLDRLCLLPRSPHELFCYWDLNEAHPAREQAVELLLWQDENKLLGVFPVVDPKVRRFYLAIPPTGQSYFVQLRQQGQEVVLLSSNVVLVPPTTPLATTQPPLFVTLSWETPLEEQVQAYPRGAMEGSWYIAPQVADAAVLRLAASGQLLPWDTAASNPFQPMGHALPTGETWAGLPTSGSWLPHELGSSWAHATTSLDAQAHPPHIKKEA